MDPFEKAARENVEKHLGDVIDEDTSIEDMIEEVYVLAFDAAKDAGATAARAREIARMIAEEY